MKNNPFTRFSARMHTSHLLNWWIILSGAFLLCGNCLHAQVPNLSWVNAAGPVGTSVQNYVHAIDTAENVFVAGSFTNAAMDFDTSAAVFTLPYSGNDDLFLAKYDPQGALLWAFSIGTNSPGTETVYSIEVSPSGDVYMCGLAYAGADFDPGTGTLLQQNGTYGFLAKYSAQGSLIWCNPMNIYARDMVVDHAGNLAVTGYFNDTVDFDPTSTVYNLSSVYGEDIFLAKYSPSGSLHWAFSLKSTYASSCIGASGWSLGNDSLDNLILQGKFKSNVDFDPGPGTYMLYAPNTTTLSHFLGKYSSNGNFIWAFNVDLNIYVSAIAIDTSDNIVMGMTFGGTDDIDPGTAVFNFTSSDPGDIGLIKYSPTGALIWATLIPGSGVEYFRGITTNQNSEILITGEVFNSVDFDPGPGQWIVPPNAYIAKYSSQSNLIWAFSIVGEGDHITEMPSGSIHWVGRMSICADFDPTSNVQSFCPGYQSGNGVFAAKFLPSVLSSSEELLLANSTSCYPNPAEQSLTVNSAVPISNVEILNIQGALVYSQACNSKEQLIDISALSPGLYFVFTTTETGTSCTRLTVIR